MHEVDDEDLARLVAPQQQPTVQRADRTGQRGAHDRPAAAGGRIQSTRHVDRHDRATGRGELVHPFDLLHHLAARLPVRPDPEHAVHAQHRIARRGPSPEDLPRLGPRALRRRSAGIAEPLHVAIDPHRTAGARERRGHHPRVAAIVAGAGEHERPAFTHLGEPAQDHLRHALARQVHEFERVSAGSCEGDRLPLARLRGRGDANGREVPHQRHADGVAFHG
jgi:hypothetical protein